MKKFLVFCASSILAFGFENSIGIGLIHSQNIYIQENDKNMVIPVLNYEDESFYAKGLEFGYKFGKTTSVLIEPSFNSYEISNLESKDNAILVGLKLEQKIEKFKINGKVMRDIGISHDGVVAKISLNRAEVIYPFVIIPSIALEYESKKVSQYYYGVPQNSSYSFYAPNQSLSWTVGVNLIYNLDSKYALNFVANNKLLSSQIKESPIVNSSNKSTFVLGVLRKF